MFTCSVVTSSPLLTRSRNNALHKKVIFLDGFRKKMFKSFDKLVRVRNLLLKDPVYYFCDDVSKNLGFLEKMKSMSHKLNYDLPHLSTLSKEMLIGRIIGLQREVDQYYRMFDSTNFDGRDKVRIPHPSPENVISKQKNRSFRKIAFRVMYLGWQYTSFAWGTETKLHEANSVNAIERVFLEALLRQQLISGIKSEVDRSRCGRTDRNVSAFSQVLTMNVRSNLSQGYGLWKKMDGETAAPSGGNVRKNFFYYEDGFPNDDISLDDGELPYVEMLNEALPLDIRVLAWAPVATNFDPRRHCLSRTYRYVFPRGRLDVDRMNEAAQNLVGFHDFRNFGKKTAKNAIKGTDREILSIEIKPLHESPFHRSLDVCVATIKGKSFIHRQIRFMMSALRMVGLGTMSEASLTDLLSVEKYPRGIYLTAASPHNLTLVDCEYAESDVCWRWDERAVTHTAGVMAENHNDSSTKTATLQHMLSELFNRIDDKSRRQWVEQQLSTSVFASTNKFEESENVLTVKERVEKSRRDEVKKGMKWGHYDAAKILAQTLDTNNCDQTDTTTDKKVPEKNQ